MGDVAVRMEGLSRRFGSVTAVDGLTLSVPKGAVFGFLGPNGAGKTTTINMLLGLIDPTKGRAEVLGFDCVREGHEVRAATGALLEDTGLYDQLSAEENLEFYGRVARMSPAERRSRIREVLGEIGLWDRRGDQVGTWSKGMRQRLALGRALLHRPAMVFLDEPTAGLDVIAAREVREALAAHVSATGTTIFLTTHNMAEAERLCDQVAVIAHGRLLAVGSPQSLDHHRSVVEIAGSGFDESLVAAIRARPEVKAVEVDGESLAVYLGSDADTAEIVGALVRAGASVREVKNRTASLEDVFVQLVEEGE